MSTASPQLQDVALLETVQPSSLWRGGHCGECFLSTPSDCQDPPQSKRHAQRKSPGVLCHKGEEIGPVLQLSESFLRDMKLTPGSLCTLRAGTLPLLSPSLNGWEWPHFALKRQKKHTIRNEESLFKAVYLGAALTNVSFSSRAHPQTGGEQ